MSRPYQPPLAPRPQAVPSRKRSGGARRRWLTWLAPLVGLVPLVVAVLASELPGRSGEPPVANAPGTVSVAGARSTPAATPTQPTAGTPAPTSSTAATTGGRATPAATPRATARATSAPPAGGATTRVGTPTPALGTGAGAGPGPQEESATPAEPGRGSGPFRAYRVQAGDTLRGIADAFGVSPASIIQASGLQNPDTLRPGQVLTIPSQTGTLYRVQPGETLDQIAARAGVPSSAILEASRLSSDTVRPGDVILIPDLPKRPAK